jgi:McbB family protein
MSCVYAVRPFGHAIGNDGMTLQNSLGFFQIENPEIAGIVRSLDGLSEVCRTELRTRISESTEESVDTVLEYLVNEIGLIAEAQDFTEPPLFISFSDKLRSLAQVILGDQAEIADGHDLDGIQFKKQTVTLAFEGHFALPDYESVVERLQEDSAISVLFQVRETIVISAPWLKSALIPCPLCTLDYASDRILFNPADSGMALSDVVDLLSENGVDQPPAIPLPASELAFALSLVPRIWDTTSNRHLVRNVPIDPHASLVVDTEKKCWSETRVPFSPLCDCVRHARRAKLGQGSDRNA